ncbi:MAG: PD40 domain-containing protein [Anaerolineales bacterium]|nr:PD40 domain-containing protein [Anaerolineales bacterium]
MKRRNRLMAVYFMLVLLLISSCNSSFNDTPISNENFSTNTEQLASTQNISSTLIVTPSPVLVNSTSTPTIEPTQQSAHFTAEYQEILTATAWQVKRDVIVTKVAQFPPVDCGGEENLIGSLSPDENWAFTVCGIKSNKISIVHSVNGVMWVLESKDFLPPSMAGAEEISGSLTQEFWDIEGGYFYFSTYLSFDIGGNDCFTGYGVNGLFRLNLKTGEVTTLISPSEYIEITFSQTGRRYAADINGVLVTDLNTGEVVQLDAENVMDLSWSPDGTKLAFSTTKCDNGGLLISSSIYVWDAITRETHTLLTINKISLSPDSWRDNKVLKIKGEDFTSNEYILTIYEYDVINALVLLSGTATPRP